MQQNQVNFLNSRIDAPIQNFVNRTFEIIKVLGQGGEGTVYLCKSINWGVNDQKQFALKCQNQSKAEEVQFIDNLILYQNQYENLINKGKSNYQPSGLIRIYDRFKSNNKDFIVMELGELDLYTYINQQQQQNLTFDQKLNILIQLAQSISYLHKINLIHRDIKPENFIKVADQFKLIDFGLTKQNSTFQKTTKLKKFLNSKKQMIAHFQQGKRKWRQGLITQNYTFKITKINQKLTKNQEQENGILIIDQQKRIKIFESNLSDIERKNDVTIFQYKNKVSELEAKLQEYIIQDTLEKEIIVQTKNQEQDQDQEYQKINSANENSIFQTLNQEDQTSQQEHFIIGDGLKVNVEQQEFQPQNNQEANQNQFEQIKMQIQDNIEQTTQLRFRYNQISKNSKLQLNQQQRNDQKQVLKNSLLKSIQSIVNKQHKCENQLNELKSYFYDQKRFDFGKLNDINKQFYFEIQTQSLINQEKKTKSKERILTN